jgi:DNA-binding MarR family transcriptional regulator
MNGYDDHWLVQKSGGDDMAAARSSGKSESPGVDPILRHWRDAVPDDRLAHLVKDAARAMVRGLQMRLAQHEVSFGHWAFLRILWETDGLTQKELSDEAGITTPTTFAAVTAMEKLGYVERRYAPDNRKNTHVYLTPRGRALKKKLVPLAEEVNEISVKGVKNTEIAIARKVLLSIIENMARDEANSNDPARRIPSTREMGNLIATRGEEYESE